MYIESKSFLSKVPQKYLKSGTEVTTTTKPKLILQLLTFTDISSSQPYTLLCRDRERRYLRKILVTDIDILTIADTAERNVIQFLHYEIEVRYCNQSN